MKEILQNAQGDISLSLIEVDNGLVQPETAHAATRVGV